MNINRIAITFFKILISKTKLSRERKRWYRKIKKLAKTVDPEQKSIPLNIKSHKKKWENLFPKINPLWYKTYSYLSGKEDINYVPEDIFYMLILPKLNRFDMVPSYRDKNMYDKYNPNIHDLFPEVILRKIEGFYYDKHFNKIDDINGFFNTIKNEKIVIKPSIDTGGGRNVLVFLKKNDSYINYNEEKLDLRFIESKYEKNLIIQNYIKQHKYFALFNKSSLNSIRITTYRSTTNEEVVILNTYLRMGGKGSYVDNVGSGGAAIQIFPDGTIQDFASDKYGKHIYSPPSKKELMFSEVGEVPYFKQICDIAKSIAKNYHYFRMLGFDFCVQENGQIRLIEINFSGLGTFQTWNRSLFGDYTDEVIEYCKE